MLLPESELKNYVLAAKDGEIGRTRDFLFDEIEWTVRYAEVNTSKWLLGNRVLISPIALGEPDTEHHRLPVNLSRQEVEDSPGIETDQPISRQYERSYHAYYGYPNYWLGQNIWGAGAYPMPLNSELAQEIATQREEQAERIHDSHLRSMREVMGYRIHALDDDIGEVADFIIDTESWQVRYLVVDIRRWLPGPSVLLSPQWIRKVSWHDNSVLVDVPKEQIKTAPRFEDELTRDDELEVFKHYHKSPYWTTPQANHSTLR